MSDKDDDIVMVSAETAEEDNKQEDEKADTDDISRGIKDMTIDMTDEAAVEAWRKSLAKDSDVDAIDVERIWIPAKIIEVQTVPGKDDLLHLNYYHWGDRWNEKVPRSSRRLAPFGTHKDEYRYPEGFQFDAEFTTSPYAHLSKDQKPIPFKATQTSNKSSWEDRVNIESLSFEREADLYKPLANPQFVAGNDHVIKDKDMEARAKADRKRDEQYEKDYQFMLQQSKGLDELDRDKSTLWVLYQSERVEEKAQEARRYEWTCKACTMSNNIETTRCVTCLTDRPVDDLNDEPKSSESAGIEIGYSSKSGKDKLKKWKSQYESKIEEKQESVADDDTKDNWSCRICTLSNKKDATKCEVCGTIKPILRSAIDFDPLQDDEEDFEEKSDIWYLRFSVLKDQSDIMEKFLKFIFQHDKRAKERSLTWAAKYNSMNCMMTLLECYAPYINLQAAPLYYAVRNENEHVCNMLLDEMQKRNEKYTVLHTCFKEVIRKDMVDVGERILVQKFYKPTEQDFELARKINGMFLEKLEARDVRQHTMQFVADDDADFDLDTWDNDAQDDNDEEPSDDEQMVHLDEEPDWSNVSEQSDFDSKHYEAESKHVMTESEMSEFEQLDNPIDNVQSAAEDGDGPRNNSNKSKDSQKSNSLNDIGMESDQSWLGSDFD